MASEPLLIFSSCGVRSVLAAASEYPMMAPSVITTAKRISNSTSSSFVVVLCMVRIRS